MGVEMTPISFALEILLDCETIEEAHKKARRYIKELEKAPQAMGVPARAITQMPPIQPVQAPSTQRILNEMMAEGSANVPPLKMPTIQGGEVNNGDGTRGKRKW